MESIQFMGSGKSNLYPSLAQSANNQPSIYISANTVVHASTGTFLKNSNRLKSGGHGQANIEEMKRRGIKFVIKKTFPNGVRLGYVPRHCEKRRRSLSEGQIGQLWFPKNWTESDIRKASKAILKFHKGEIKNGIKIVGWYNNVKVGIIINNHQITTIFPTKEQE
jgi:hypothetical protein